MKSRTEIKEWIVNHKKEVTIGALALVGTIGTVAYCVVQKNSDNGGETPKLTKIINMGREKKDISVPNAEAFAYSNKTAMASTYCYNVDDVPKLSTDLGKAFKDIQDELGHENINMIEIMIISE